MSEVNKQTLSLEEMRAAGLVVPRTGRERVASSVVVWFGADPTPHVVLASRPSTVAPDAAKVEKFRTIMAEMPRTRVSPGDFGY